MAYTPIVANLHQLLRLNNYQAAITEFHNIKNLLPKLPAIAGSYCRGEISKQDGYWLSILNWDKNVTSAIHGHPDTAFMYIINGEIICQQFSDPSLSKSTKQKYSTGDYFYSYGNKNTFTNGIHQIFSNNQTQSLHFYSDDPQKGYIF